ncbi:MAG: PP2C family protein-serine/threonine phosphatase [Lachnospiraceae bacterium]|nr:PP2C family protein-serine/threonine phosphatase [Lachnospiraceae bacterium]
MAKAKKFKDILLDKITHAIGLGNVYAVNEIAANMMLGIINILIIILMILCLIANEIGIFTADKVDMRIATGIAVVLEIPAILLNKKFAGEKRWLKFMLMGTIVILCAVLSAILGHNVTLVMALPVVLSVRYCEDKFCKFTTMLTTVFFTASAILYSYIGILNLNIVKVLGSNELHVVTSLRDAVIAAGYDQLQYLKSVIINDYLPRYIVFFVIAFCCVKIAKRGREMVELQNKVTMENSRIETELNLARDIQTSMLPCIFPAFPNHDQVQLFAKNITAKEVGGDFYDFFSIDDEHIAIVMADVSGKGIGAALFMTIAKIVIKNQLQSGLTTAQAMTFANRLLCENNNAGLFVTTWVGIYDIIKKELNFTNAGHNPPILYRKDEGCSYLKNRHGLVLAGMETTRYKESTITLNIGDVLFLYTDGVTEAINNEQELFGEERLLEVFRQNTSATAEEQIGKVLEAVDKFVGDTEQFDDITMLCMRIDG